MATKGASFSILLATLAGSCKFLFFLFLYQPICGYAFRDALRFKKPTGHKDLFYIDDKDVEFKEVLESPLPKAPLIHLLHPTSLRLKAFNQQFQKMFQLKTLMVHVLFWFYHFNLIRLIFSSTWNWYFAFHAAPSDGKKAEYKEDGLSVDVKLPIKHVLSRELQLYFDKIVDITMNKSVSILFKQALLSLATDLGLHPLVPYFTCFIADEDVLKIFHTSLYMCVAKNFWLLHQLMPSIITCLVAKRLGNKFTNLGNKFTDNHWELRNFRSKASGINMQKLLKPEIKTHKAWCVYRALLQQPPAKKIATESAIGMMPINSMQTDLQWAVSGFSTTIGGSNIGVSSMSRPLSNDNMLGREVRGRVSKTSTVLAQAWKEDTDPGNLLASLFELFGESMLSFTPKPELSFFL
ncbi:hypothetical protein GOBAR_AA05115 [Gossypium barbadense]|uniref:TAF6 C-terminal HEAT repeat domain-containing protein n=1 Tax=Gossypium barbadense TaxID=3634 RepID=A0A2P5YIT8_GOSBA|nr:hypothetical protein GOBAR_AA05115 [Gossypium barbadense]